MSLTPEEIAEIEAIALYADRKGSVYIASRLRALLPREETIEEAAACVVDWLDKAKYFPEHDVKLFRESLRAALERRRKEQVK